LFIKDSLYRNGLKGIRLIQLAKNSVQFETISNETFVGYIERECGINNEAEDTLSEGLIRYESSENDTNSNKINSSSPSFKTIIFTLSKSNNVNDTQSSYSPTQMLYYNDKVQFNISTCLRSKLQQAVNVKLVEQAREQGYITMLKDSYGFIELSLSSSLIKNSKYRDIFFHNRYEAIHFYLMTYIIFLFFNIYLSKL
jgi:hypothetical protein